jgi:hypothetical protein
MRPSAALTGLLLASAGTTGSDAFVVPSRHISSSPLSDRAQQQHIEQHGHRALPTNGADIGLSDILANPTETLTAVQSMVSEELFQSTDRLAAFMASITSGDASPIDALAAALSSGGALSEFATPLHVAAIAAFALGSSLNLWLNTPDDYAKIGAPYVPGTTTYSPAASESFYGARPFLVAKRVLKLATLTSAFNTGILFDWLVLGKLFKDEEYTALKKAEPARAKVALRLAEQLGPTFIKLG